MNTLSQAYLNLTIEASVDEIEVVRDYFSDIAKHYALEIYGQSIQIEIRVEHGSLKAWIKVGGLITTAVIAYGGLRTGIDYLVRDARTFDEVVISRFVEDAGIPEEKVYRVERRLGMPGRIQRLLAKIDKIQDSDYTNSIVRKELEELREDVQKIVDDLDSDADRETFVTNLPDAYRDVRPTKPPSRKLPSMPMPMLKPDHPDDFESDGSLAEFADKYGHRQRITRKK